MTGPVLLHQIFAEAVRRWPDRVAIDVPPASRRPERRVLTYVQLARRSDDLARLLQPAVTAADSVVVVLLPRAPEHLYVAQLAVLKAGAAFTCIDPAFPDGQVQTILEDCRPVAILTDDTGLARVRRLGAPTLAVDVVARAARALDAAPAPVDPDWLSPGGLAYLIYTSGTTGRPKGVMIEHRSIVNLVRGDLATLGVTPDDRVAQTSSPAYDSSIEETWFALAAGAALVAMDDETTRLGPDLVSWLRRERITMFSPTPTLLRSTGCQDPARELPELRLLHPGGEALTQDLVDRWAPGRRLVNDYGPTETTVTSLRGAIAAGEPVSIGRPVTGMHAWVLGPDLEEVPVGEQGELCIGGVGLARGYHNEPALTAARFRQHPRLGRIYRSGDLASQDADGNFRCHGRIDTQVKIRGYRIELEAIEARMAECAGVREAACTVQGEGAQKLLAGFVVPDDASAPPSFEAIKSRLRSVLPAYMVPVRFGLLAQLPRSTSSKLDRRALPVLEANGHEAPRSVAAPRNALEEKLMSAFCRTLERTDGVSIHDDFFNELGGDSLSAAILVSLLRDEPDTAALTVRDLYEARTVAELAQRAGDRPHQNGHAPRDRRDGSTTTDPSPSRTLPGAHPVLATLVQTLWLVAGVVLTAPLTYFVAFWLLPRVIESQGLVAVVALAPVLYLGGLAAYAVSMVALAVLAKRFLIGVYRPVRAPVWGSLFVRNWIVQQCVRLVPWRIVEITVLQNAILRALGARIGRRVHIHRGVNLTQGGWDLLDIGDDVTIGQDARLQLVTLEDGQIRFGHVALEDGATLEVRAGVGADTHVGANAELSPWSYLPEGQRIPAGERWDGVPAQRAEPTAAQPDLPRTARPMSPGLHGALLILGRLACGAVATLPLLTLGLLLAWSAGLDGPGVLEWLVHPSVDGTLAIAATLLAVMAVPLMLLSRVAAMHLLGRVRPGVIDRWSLAYVRVRLKTELLESSGRWLSGALAWPVWLRAAGMKIGRGCEVSTIIDTLPELVEIGPETFLADGIHLAGPRVSRGRVELAPVRLDSSVFLGNHAVIGGGQRLPADVLVGVCTVADDRTIRSGTAWFGHPPFELHNREPVVCDRRLTHEPSWPRYANRLLWELLRFSLPLVPVVVGLLWFGLLASAATAVSLPVLLLGVLPALTLGAIVVPTMLVLALKWILLGRVRPGTHPLWSSWVSRWDFLYVAWDFCAAAALTALEGTLLLNAYLRAMGVRIGRQVVLGPGFVHVADPDMLDFEDHATLSCGNQSHTFEDRVLKLDVVRVRRGATVGSGALLLYGADVGERTSVMPHSVVMKRERLAADLAYAGFPTRPVQRWPRAVPAPSRVVGVRVDDTTERERELELLA